MSVKMYNYRINKDDLWQFVLGCREFYMQNHPLHVALREKARDEGFSSKVFTSIKKHSDELTMDVQLFNEGETYLVRILESGWFFLNKLSEIAEATGIAIEKVFYDNRTDVPPEDEKNAAVADWCDEMINTRQYLTVELVSIGQLKMMMLDVVLNRTAVQKATE